MQVEKVRCVLRRDWVVYDSWMQWPGGTLLYWRSGRVLAVWVTRTGWLEYWWVRWMVCGCGWLGSCMGLCALAVWELALAVGYGAGCWVWCWVRSMGCALAGWGPRMSICALAVWELTLAIGYAAGCVGWLGSW